MLTLPETPGHPYRGVLAGPHLSRPCRFLVPPPFESLSLTLAGSGRVFVTGAGVRNHLILRRRSCVAKLDAGCFPHNSQPRQERMLLLLPLKLTLNSIGVTIRARVRGAIWS